MRKLKIGAAVLLTLALLAFWAFLPKIVGAIQDIATIGTADSHQIQTVQLEIQEEVTPLGKLAMLRSMESMLEISESSASLTAEEVVALAREALAPYEDVGLVESTENWSVYELRPLLVQVPDHPELSGIVWDLVMTGEDTGANSSLNLAIDDGTGKILVINYAHDPEYDRRELLDALAGIYFINLGIPNYAGFETSDLAGQYVGDDTAGIRYRFGDAVYGEINVDFYINPYGFHIDMP